MGKPIRNMDKILDTSQWMKLFVKVHEIEAEPDVVAIESRYLLEAWQRYSESKRDDRRRQP